MRQPEYFARWYDDSVFLSTQSSRKSGDFTQQQCEVEVKLPKGADEDLTINLDLAVGARIYANNDDQNFTALPQQEFDWYNAPMEYSEELEEVPTYENEQVEVAEEKAFEISANDVFSDKISQLAATRAQASIAIEVDGPASAVSRQTTTYSASQSTSHGFQTYPKLTESDWWWVQMGLDIPDELMADGEIMYQYITFEDTTGGEAPFTIGCKTTYGVETDYAVDVYTQTTDKIPELFSNNTDSVIGKAYNAQGPRYIEEASDVKWSAGTARVGSTVSASTTAGNTNHGCYFYKELPKIGRNPNDFDKDFKIHVGARIYASSSATTFTAVPEAESTIRLAAPPSYYVAPAGAFSMLYSAALATIMAILMMSF